MTRPGQQKPCREKENKCLMKISSGDDGGGGLGGGGRGEKAAASQDAMLLHEKYLDRKHQRKESYITTTCLTQVATASERELTPAVMPATEDNRREVTGERTIQTHTQSVGGSGGNNDNKWSHNQQNSISSTASSSPGAAHMQQRHQLVQHQRQQSVSSINLILSILIGLSLTAIHTSALTGGGGGGGGQSPGSPASSAPTGGGQQMGGAMSAASTASGSSLGETSGRSYLQPPSVTTKPQSAISLDQSPAINLIPIDQPVSSSSVGGGGSQSGSVAPSSGSQANNNFRPLKDSYDGSSINLRAAMASPSQEAGVNSAPSSSSASSQPDDLSSGQFALQQQQTEDDFSEPIAQFYSNANDGLVEGAYQTIIEPAQQQEKQQLDQPAQAKSTSGPLLVTPRQSVERRFGLFKKGHHHSGQQQHYGMPSMSANYAAGPYLTDCERCLASFGQQQQTAADLQQLEPPASLPPAPLPAALPVMPSLPALGGGHYPMQPFAPLKNKFFMKFPFLAKPSPFGGGGGDISAGQHSYWPVAPLGSYQPSQSGYQHHPQQQQRPSSSGMSQALFIRPAPAYNCVQASPPLLQAAASAYTSSQAEVGSSKTSPVASAKQQHYGGHHHQQQQQQQVQGYASKK